MTLFGGHPGKIEFELQYFQLAAFATRGRNSTAILACIPQQKRITTTSRVVIPVGRVLPEQMQAIADVAETYGRGIFVYSPGQNLMIPHIASADLEAVKSRIVAMSASSREYHRW